MAPGILVELPVSHKRRDSRSVPTACYQRGLSDDFSKFSGLYYIPTHENAPLDTSRVLLERPFKPLSCPLSRWKLCQESGFGCVKRPFAICAVPCKQALPLPWSAANGSPSRTGRGNHRFCTRDRVKLPASKEGCPAGGTNLAS